MHVIHSESGSEIQATVSKLDAKEIALINKSKRFDFNWNKEKQYDVYKLTAEGIDEPLGLMSLADRPADFAIEIRLLASSLENVSKAKQYQRIAGCLIAFACRGAFEAGYGGYVCLKPKTELEAYYQRAYGFVSTKLFLITHGNNSLSLIKKYYEKQDEQ
ncbi:hypothetical protein [Mucilaginibacter gotjawali]|uniref:Uncharacterized protein n=2 Tax=Mucilaginibacter gotjawali TaxID=1550579 RepID=A0A839SL18_9SPHI|nr:hypothetical protein [Mucilaginibacter gotjawali]MBB3058098.1 hypothetical protein [Mucilaginibacter gotjawali]BAU52073.1 hypothetical protein MgSA37_00223 [Mucilaginibacter gotjawali]